MKNILFFIIAICILSSCSQNYFQKNYDLETVENDVIEEKKTEEEDSNNKDENDLLNENSTESIEESNEVLDSTADEDNTKTTSTSDSDSTNDKQNKTETEVEENQDSIKEKKWTLIVYMAADNNLESACIENLNEMEAALIPEEVSILALVDRSVKFDSSNENWTDTRLYEIKHDEDELNKTICSKQISCPNLGLIAGENTELNMSDENVLGNLITFSKKKYTAKNYGLIIWGHGTGYGNATNNENCRAVAVDDESESCMEITKFHNAVKNSMEDDKINFIAFDTCFGAELEIAYELKDCAQYLTGLEGTTPYGGWNYYDWFNNCDFKNDDATLILNALKKQYEQQKNYFSIIDLSKINNVFEKYELFCLEVTKKIETTFRQNKIFEIITKDTSKFYAAGEESSLYVDIYDMSQKIMERYSTIKTCALNLQNSIKEAIVNSDSEQGIYPLGINFCLIDADETIIKKLPDSYIQGSNTENQCMFVKDSKNYVPTLTYDKTLLNYLFYKTFSK